MNERILDLANKATSYCDTLDVADQIIYQDIWKREFAELIVLECLVCCGSQADKNNLLKHFGLLVESNIQYQAPPVHNSVTSQYTRKYNIPKNEE